MKLNQWVLVLLLLINSGSSLVFAQSQYVAEMYSKLEKGNEELDDRQLLELTLKLKKDYESALLKNDSLLARIYHLTGRSYWQLDSLIPGKKYTEEAVKINLSGSVSASPANCANSYFNLIGIERGLNNVSGAKKAFDSGIRIARQYPAQNYLLPEFYQTIANLFYDVGDYQKCIEFSEIGERISITQNLPEAQINNLFEKIQALIALKKVNEGFLLLQTASKIALRIKDQKTKGFVMSQVAGVFKAQGEYANAIEAYDNALQHFKKILVQNNTNSDARFNCAVVLNNIGNIYLEEIKDYPKSLIYFQQSLKFVNENLARSRILGNIADSYSRMNQFDMALKSYDRAFEPLAVADNGNKNTGAKSIRNVSGKLYLLTLIQDKANNWLRYAKYLHNDKAKLKNALNTYMLADTMVDYMRWEHTGTITKLFWRDKTRTMYERAIETCYLLNDPVSAFHFFEKSRAVLLNDQLNELGANQLLSAGDQKKEVTLKQKVSDLQNKLEENANDKEIAARTRSELYIAQEQQESFIRQIEKTSPQYYAYKYDNRVPTVGEIRNKILTDNQTFVCYFVGDSAVYGLGISSHNIIFNKIDLSEYYTNTVQFEKLIGNREAQNRNFDGYLSVSSKLYELLLQPFHVSENTRIIISPDGSFLPFEALRTSGPDADYLVKKYAFSYTYSASFLMKSLRSSNAGFTTKYFLGLAPVQFAPKLSQAALPGSDIALKAIEKYFLFSKTLTGADASRNVFVKESGNYRVVQLLTHATADSAVTVPTIYFADSTLKLNELSSSGKSNTELLILSACRTGVGKNQRGEGVFSLARGFAGIGIPSTLTTLWSVENESVYELTKLFYAGLEKGIPLDMALQSAQIKWLKTASASDQLPYAWAGMVLIGNNEPVSLGISKEIAYVFIGGIATLFVFLIFYLRKRRSRNKTS